MRYGRKITFEETAVPADFTVLARSVFAQGGVVCGVVMDEDFKVFHTVATNEKSLFLCVVPNMSRVT